MAVSHYKARGQSRQGCCLLCQTATVGPVVRVDLGYGDWVLLCVDHASPSFRARRGGRDYALSLLVASHSAGPLARRRKLALKRLFSRLGGPPPPLGSAERELAKPQSYAFKRERRLVEAACAKGVVTLKELRDVVERSLGVIARRKVDGPTSRTIRRWRADARWLLPGWQPPAGAARR